MLHLTNGNTTVSVDQIKQFLFVITVLYLRACFCAMKVFKTSYNSRSLLVILFSCVLKNFWSNFFILFSAKRIVVVTSVFRPG